MAVGTFIGDRLGSSGWDVRLEDGTETQVFFKLPTSMGSAEMVIEDAPGGRSMEELLPLWLDSLDSIVTDAEKTFSGAPR